MKLIFFFESNYMKERCCENVCEQNRLYSYKKNFYQLTTADGLRNRNQTIDPLISEFLHPIVIIIKEIIG